VESLAGLYHISSENLAQQRQFIGLDADSSATLETGAQSQELSVSLTDLSATAERLLDASRQFSV
jgi:hypothetical protein